MNPERRPMRGVIVKRVGTHVVLMLQGRQHFLDPHDAKALGEALAAESEEAANALRD